MWIVSPPKMARKMQEKTEERKPMQWVDYNIIQAGPNFTIKGAWPGEVMGWPKDQNDNANYVKENILYRPGDRFIVNESGWLMRCNPEDESKK